RVADLEEIPRIMTRIRKSPPTEFAGVPIERVDDFATGVADFEPSDILRFTLGDGSRVIVRPSGTEPKVKVYLDASSSEGTAAQRLARARERIAALEVAARELLAP